MKIQKEKKLGGGVRGEGGGLGGQGGCERRIEVFVIIQKKFLGGGVRVGNKNTLYVFKKEKKKRKKNPKNKNDVYKTLCPQQMLVHKGGHINNVQLIIGLRIAEMSQLQNCSVMCTKNGSYCENEKKREKVRGEGGCVQRMEFIVKKKKSGGGGGGGGSELRSEAFVNFQKKKKN